MDDLISRQAAIYAIEKRMDDITCEEFAEGMSEAITEINLLPSAQPERKKGKWIKSDPDGFVCSVCLSGYKDQPTLMGRPMFEFCPFCGARMEE